VAKASLACLTDMSAATARRQIDLEDLCGLAATLAVERLRACDLRPAIEAVEVAERERHAHVVDQVPQPRSQVRRGQLITLVIGQSTAAERVLPPALPSRAVEHRRERLGIELADALDDLEPGEKQTSEPDVTARPAAPGLPPAPQEERTDRPPTRSEARKDRVRRRRLPRPFAVVFAAAAIAAVVLLANAGHPVRHLPRPAAARPPGSLLEISEPRQMTAVRARLRSARPGPRTLIRVPRNGPHTAVSRQPSQTDAAIAAMVGSHAPPRATTARVFSAPSSSPPSPTGPLPGPYPNEP
jgi:hypothetical protein